ncbi:hypothetical protein GCM10009551_075570 [Nocardiopsis tropica]|uniref:DUF4328 domain-containing protein n=1 Tax=Tsukamurella TaxID=2060 RepID=UPI001C7C9F35|nr:DUF4328 domain-containing protein [Tsukamurella sp. TY48]GIZ97053.1 hypothetical protein TTY48_16650 [Tsukamurella sp. TY48]
MQPTARTQPPGRRIRWLARRPPETLPVPRRAPSEQGPTPKYTDVPRWGLRQEFAPAPVTEQGRRAESATTALVSVLQGTIAVLVLAALAEAAAYLLLVINRAGPISKYLAWGAEVSVFAIGWLAVIALVVLYIVFARWLQAARAAVYGELGTLDPRPTWQLWVYCLVPVVNLVAAPVLAMELVGAQDRVAGRAPSSDGRLEFIRRWWAGWVALSIVTLACVAYAQASGGLQHHADAVLYTAITYALGAAFLVVTLRVVRAIDAGPDSQKDSEEGRWLAV